MDIVERLRQIDFTFWYSPIGPDEKFEPREIGKMSHEAADEIERLREKNKELIQKMQWCATEYNSMVDDYNKKSDEIEELRKERNELREENQKQKEQIMLLNSLVQTEHKIIRAAVQKIDFPHLKIKGDEK